jgi:intein-encoded DNA endonuclease-like protein
MTELQQNVVILVN